MKIAVYKKAITRTLPDLGSLALNLSHMALGASSEVSELQEALNKKEKDPFHIGEEGGDNFWYGGNWCNLRNIEIPDDIFDNLEEGYEMTDVAIYAGKLSDIAKRLLAYGQSLEVQEAKRKQNEGDAFMTEVQIIHAYLRSVARVVKAFNLDVEIVMGKNIVKLYVRYKAKFTEDEALCRDLESERISLESNVE